MYERCARMEKAYLILETGEVFEGKGFGAVKESIGELVFTTAVVGYVDSLTDPSYYGQTLMFTFPQIGNYGIIPLDGESKKCHVKGVVVHDWCTEPSNFRCQGTLDAFLKEQDVPGICGVDTRRLTQIVREHGVMNAIITSKVPENMLAELRNYKITGAVEATASKETQVLLPAGDIKRHVVLMNYGAKSGIADHLLSRGCKVTILPYNAAAEDVMNLNPDGIILSNGPGDPGDNPGCVAELKKLLGKVPMFGIGLGHQLLALAAGGETMKLKYGHRGGNQPVRDLQTGRSIITGQNHGYAVKSESLEAVGGVARYVNLNDNTCEGAEYPELGAFSLQFFPDTHGGPRGMEDVYDRFVTMMGGDR